MLASPPSTLIASYSTRTSHCCAKLSAPPTAVGHVGLARAVRAAAESRHADGGVEVIRREAELAEQRERRRQRQTPDRRSVQAGHADVEADVAERREVIAPAHFAEIEVADFDREVLVERVAAEDLETGIAVVDVGAVECVVADLRRADARRRRRSRAECRPAPPSRPSGRGSRTRSIQDACAWVLSLIALTPRCVTAPDYAGAPTTAPE